MCRPLCFAESFTVGEQFSTVSPSQRRDSAGETKHSTFVSKHEEYPKPQLVVFYGVKYYFEGKVDLPVLPAKEGYHEETAFRRIASFQCHNLRVELPSPSDLLAPPNPLHAKKVGLVPYLYLLCKRRTGVRTPMTRYRFLQVPEAIH